MDWPPALHARSWGMAENYPGAEPRSLVVGAGRGWGWWEGEDKNCRNPCHTAWGWVLATLPG